jgi:aspartate aminotransferase
MISKNVEEKMKAGSWIRAMFEEGARLKKIHGANRVYDLTLGNPYPPAPKEVASIVSHLLSTEASSIHKYMNNAGFEDVRNAIAENLNQSMGTSLQKKHLVMTVGAAGAINVILKTLLNPGDEVILLAPYFVEYLFYLDNHAGVPVVVKTLPGTFQLDLLAIEKSITQKTKAIILNSPNNPSGAVYPESDLIKLSELLEKKSLKWNSTIYVISDEPYKELVYAPNTVPHVLTLFKNVFLAYSFSKSLSLAGERIGYIAVSVSPELEDPIIDGLIFCNRILGFVNAPSLFQKVVKELLGQTVDVSFYQEKRDFLCENLKSIGYNFTKPAGTFFFFVESLISDDIAFVKEAINHKLLLVPGTGFGYPGYFRLSYSMDMETLKGSLDAFASLYQKYKG